ncbi:hypothetical protein CSU_0181 [Campylobacter jejuni subsp. jejuni 327]|nr:hypothetical protein CSU_0181 [Campylobacter jejuni subsp. jejuni 327]
MAAKALILKKVTIESLKQNFSIPRPREVKKLNSWHRCP